MDDREELIGGLRDLADMLAKQPVIPTPVVSMTASLRWGHSFGEVLHIAEVLAPCTVVDSMLGPEKKVITTTRAGVQIRVIVNAAEVGETRIVNGLPQFMVDTEVLRIAAHPKPTALSA